MKNEATKKRTHSPSSSAERPSANLSKSPSSLTVAAWYSQEE